MCDSRKKAISGEDRVRNDDLIPWSTQKLESFILRTECNQLWAGWGQGLAFKIIHFEYENLFCTTGWRIGTQQLHAWIMFKFTLTSKLLNLIQSCFTMHSFPPLVDCKHNYWSVIHCKVITSKKEQAILPLTRSWWLNP